LHKHLLRFFKFYGCDFNVRENMMSIRKGGFLDRRDYEAERRDQADKGSNGRGTPLEQRLFIESPLNIFDSVSDGAWNYNLVKKYFVLAYQILKWQAPHSKSFLVHIISDKLFLYLAKAD